MWTTLTLLTHAVVITLVVQPSVVGLTLVLPEVTAGAWNNIKSIVDIS